MWMSCNGSHNITLKIVSKLTMDDYITIQWYNTKFTDSP